MSSSWIDTALQDREIRAFLAKVRAAAAARPSSTDAPAPQPGWTPVEQRRCTVSPVDACASPEALADALGQRWRATGRPDLAEVAPALAPLARALRGRVDPQRPMPSLVYTLY